MEIVNVSSPKNAQENAKKAENDNRKILNLKRFYIFPSFLN